jgi:hypothetical protein
MKDFNAGKVGKDILNEILSHGISIEELYKNIDENEPIEVEVQKEFQTSKSKIILDAIFNIQSFNYIIAILSITRSFEAITDVESGSMIPVEETTSCAIAGRITDGYISEAIISAKDDTPDMLYFESKSTEEIGTLLKVVRPDTYEAKLFLEQIKLLLEDETFYKDEIQIKGTSDKKADRYSIPIKRNNGIFS